MPKKILIGRVASDKMDKTRRVEITRRIKHPLYGKYYSRSMACHAHDENNESKVGDTVEIIESRPRSKTKRWELVKVIEKSREVDVAALKAARESAPSE
ncbi:MAG: 30S ribosomal protein S17 [Pirellulales bacterium]|jgi:small subunit ribosomal protein S17